MDIILYNPLSKSGKSEKAAFKLQKKLNKKHVKTLIISLLTIDDIHEFIEKYKDINRFIILGGDGTLNVLANRIGSFDIKPDFYLYRSGTGNDFARSVKARGKLINIKKYFYGLPRVSFNNDQKRFLNGVGLGLDGLVVNKVNNSRHKNTKFNYFRHAFEAIREHKKSAVEVTVNGKIYYYNDSWFVSVMNSKYFGGGMKIAPKQKRDQKDLSVVIVHKAPKLLVPFLFPLIYLGLHAKIKRYVKIFKGDEITINFKQPQMMQIDGEDFSNIQTITVTK